MCILTVKVQSLSFLFFMHALCAHAQGSVDLHVESYGVAGPLVETLYSKSSKTLSRNSAYMSMHVFFVYASRLRSMLRSLHESVNISHDREKQYRNTAPVQKNRT